MEGAGVEPEAIDRPTKAEAFGGGQDTAVFGVVLPFPGRVDFFPFLGCDAHCHELLEEG